MTELTIRVPDVEPGISQALEIVTWRHAEPAAIRAYDPDEHPDGQELDDGPETDGEVLAVSALIEGISAAEPGSPRQGTLALAMYWLDTDEHGWSWEKLTQTVLQSLPVDHPHWSLWVEDAGLGTKMFMGMIGPPSEGEPSMLEVASGAYIAEVAQRHPDAGVRLHAAGALGIQAVLRRSLGRPKEQRHAELEAAIRHLYRDRPDQLEILLRAIPELLFEPGAFLREFPVGSPAPDFSLRLIDGRQVTLADLAGSPVLIYFTGTWCPPCQIETPAIVALHKKWHPRGVRFLGVAMEESDEGFTDYLAAKGITWDFAVVAEGDPIIETFLVQGYPSLLMLGPHGTVLGGDLRASEEPEALEAMFEYGLYEAQRPAPQAAAQPPAPAPAPTAAALAAPDPAVVTALAAGTETLTDGLRRMGPTVDVQAPWTVDPPGSAEGTPLELGPANKSDTELVDRSLVDPAGKTLSGGFGIEATEQIPRTERVLANGLRVVVEQDSSTPIATVCLTYRVGSRNEVAGSTGLAHLFEHLMFAGTDRAQAGEHDRVMQAVGAQYNAMTTHECTTYFDTVPAAALPLTLWLEADRMHGIAAALDTTKLDSERDVVKNERRQNVDNVPYGAGNELITELLFPPGHPYRHSIIGSMEDLDRQSLDDVRAFFQRHYVPANAALAIVGDVDPAETLELVEQYFGTVPPGDVPAMTPAPALGPIEPAPEPVLLDDPAPMPALILAWRVPPERHPCTDAVDVALTVLGRGHASRVSDRLIRGRELLVDGGCDLQLLTHGNSFAMLYAFPPPGSDIAPVEEAIGAELALLAAQGPTETELARAVAIAERSHLDEVSTFEGRAMALARSLALHGRADAQDDYPDRIRAVTADDVREAARLLSLDHAVRIVYPATSSRSEFE